MNKTGIVYNSIYLKHETGGHPERGSRLTFILASLEEYGLLDKLVKIEPVKAQVEDILRVHDRDYIEKLAAFAKRGGGNWDEDTVISKDTYQVALWAAGGVIAALDAVMRGDVNSAFALVRPPGHHAEKNKAMGFCVFNNIAVAVQYARQKYGLKRLLIVDWDAHHGNGTQKTFYEDPEVLFFSVHQNLLFPHSGWLTDNGAGRGLGYNINVPLPGGSGDASYYYLFSRLLEPVANQFKPEIIFISAGFDAHFSDELSGLEVTAGGFAQMAETIKRIADNYSNGRIVAALEGGYNLYSIGPSIASVINIFGGFGFTIEDSMPTPMNFIRPQARGRIDEALKFHSQFWDLS